MKITINSFWPAAIWLLLSTIAFCLPGSALPSNDWFGIIQLDKWIHVGILSVMIVLWCLPLFHKPNIQLSLKMLFIWISLSFFGYGVLMELVQHFFIPNRSFAWGDIGADAVGCLTGLLVVRWQLK
jgi:hypothetical protein